MTSFAADWRRLEHDEQPHTDRYPQLAAGPRALGLQQHHVLLANLLYELPIGKGKKLASAAPSWANQIIGGWSFTGIFTYPSGEPYSITSGSLGERRECQLCTSERTTRRGPHPVREWSGRACDVQRRSVHHQPVGPKLNCVNVTGTQTFFCIPPAGQNGNGRNIVQGPNFWNLDSGLLKDFGITERFKLQFRAELFNVLNHANWENPRNATSGSPSVQSSIFARTCCVSASLPASATVIAIGEPNRVMQLGLKLNF